MKHKLLAFFFALMTGIGIVNAETVQIGELYYVLNDYDKTAAVTYKSHESGIYNAGWNITEAVIPETVEYNDETYTVTRINSNTFHECKNLLTVIIPNSVTSIGEFAFAGSFLNSITIPNSVTDMGGYTFYDCSNLVSVVIGNGITSIGGSSFSGCSNLTSVTIPNSVTSIGGYAFFNCVHLTSVTIPNSLTVIASSLFASCTSLTSIELPNTITAIGSDAFRGCSNLSIYVPCGELTRFQEMLPNDSRVKYNPLPYTLSTTAENGAVTSNIADVTICDEPIVTLTATPATGYHFVQWSDGVATNPRAIEMTKDTSFTAEFAMDLSGTCGKDNALSWVYQPSSGMLAVIGSGELTENYTFSLVAKEMKTLMISEGITAIGYDAFGASTNLVSLTLPTTLTEIGEFAFSDCAALASVTIPAGVTKIGTAAFMNCTSLTSIIIPEGVTDLGSGATFQGCTGLSSVVWNAKNATISSDNEGNKYSIFNGLDAITSFSFGQKVEAIPYALCLGLAGITEISIPNSVTSIGIAAFEDCTGLTQLTIPESVNSIGQEAFLGCTKLDTLRILNGNAIVDAYTLYECQNLRYVEAPASTFNTYVARYSQWFSTKLGTVVVNGGTLTPTGFAQIELSSGTLSVLDLEKANVSSLREEQFSIYRKLTELRLPASLNTVGYAIAADAYYLKAITIPAYVTEIDDRAFDNCRSLTTVEFAGNAITRIGNWAFYNCHELTDITLPDGVEEIGSAAFYGCAYMQTAHIPASVRSIGDNTFAFCSKLNKMEVGAVVPPIVEDKTFFEVSTTAPVYVPESSVTAYKAHPVWGRLNIVARNETSTEIENVPSDQVQCTKVLRDGQIYILRGEQTYTVTGQKLQ
ncbi:MAG: leucine-rich repeat domain-containing protein [Paludibacteraceae bacterium]|nr:leucine-rich repeat domain-containing protein [Paludibacteraceae bacterium]